jgi:hypothetical protein
VRNVLAANVAYQDPAKERIQVFQIGPLNYDASLSEVSFLPCKPFLCGYGEQLRCALPFDSIEPLL